MEVVANSEDRVRGGFSGKLGCGNVQRQSDEHRHSANAAVSMFCKESVTMSFISKRLEDRRESMRSATGLEIIRNAVSTRMPEVQPMLTVIFKTEVRKDSREPLGMLE
jgi:hypothetical protein